MNYDEVFTGFLGRDNELRAVTRYSIYKPMFYRTNLLTHAHRAAVIVKAIEPYAIKVFGNKYDPIKAEILALVHDDAEIEFGDIQAGNKSKMTPEQLEEVRQAELSAIEKISKRFPTKVMGYNYKSLLRDAADYSSLESKIVCYADKYDALGEALHEIFAGNQVFHTNVHNEYGEIPTPNEYYPNFFAGFTKKFPVTKPLFAFNAPILQPLNHVKYYNQEVNSGRPHTENSLKIPKGDKHYDTWLSIVLNCNNKEVVQDLFTQKEFL